MRKRLWIAVVISLSVTLLAAGGLFFVNRSRSQADVYGQMPAFSLTDQDGKPLTSDDVKGKVVLFSFIYTNCPDICPMLTARERSLQKEMANQNLLGPDVMFVSISVDPERDTPPVLKQYAERYDADTRSWKFVTGDLNHVKDVVTKGFLAGIEQDEHHHGQMENYLVAHSGKIAMVDKQGRIRGYYDGDNLNIAQVISAVKALR